MGQPHEGGTETLTRDIAPEFAACRGDARAQCVPTLWTGFAHTIGSSRPGRRCMGRPGRGCRFDEGVKPNSQIPRIPVSAPVPELLHREETWFPKKI